MTETNPLEDLVTDTLTKAAATVPDDVTTRLMRAVDAGSDHTMTPAASTGHRSGSARPRTVWLLVAAVAVIAATPTFLNAGRTVSTPPTAAPTSSSAPDPSTNPSPVLAKQVSVSGESLTGQEVSTADYLGAPLLVTVWGSYCRPCRTAASTAAELSSNHDLQVLGIAAHGFSRAGERAAAEYLNLAYSSIYDPRGQISDRLFDQARGGAVPGYPFTVLLDADGQVVQSWVGPEPSRSILRAVRALPSENH